MGPMVVEDCRQEENTPYRQSLSEESIEIKGMGEEREKGRERQRD